MHICRRGGPKVVLMRGFPIVVLSILVSSIVIIRSVLNQETVAEIIDVTYPKTIPEAEPFNLTISIQSFSNKTETFLVRIVHSPFISIQKEIILSGRSIGNATFELKLLLSRDLAIELLLDDKLVDSLSLFLEVPAPKTDVGMLMIELVQAEFAVIGVTLAALAIFATIFIQAKHRWLVEESEFIEKLKKQQRRRSEKEKKIIRCATFLAQEEYSECLTHFLDTSLVREMLSKIANLEKREIIHSNFTNIRRSTVTIAFILVTVVSYGFPVIFLSPPIVDTVMFLYPYVGARDIFLGIYVYPLSIILFSGILHLISVSFWSQFGKWRRLATGVVFTIFVLVLIALHFHIWFVVGLLIAFVLGVVFGLLRIWSRHRKERKVLFRKELIRIKQLAENLRKLHEKAPPEFQKEEEDLRQRFTKKLDHFRFAFESINEDMVTRLQRIQAERSLDLLSEDRSRELHRQFDSIAKNAKNLISEIPT